MKCGQCNIDFASKKQGVRHLMDVHGSVFIEGSEDLQAIQEQLGKEDKRYADLIARKKQEND